MEEINQNMPESIDKQQNKPNHSSSSQQQPANQVDDQPGPSKELDLQYCMQYQVCVWMKQVIMLWVFFLKAGADFSTKNDRGQTPLHYAAATGYDSMVSCIKSGAHPNIQDIEGRDVFHYILLVSIVMVKL
ncbi:hypothetical protein TNCV_2461601 [Trichonephila clavipes]|nr:hypothetical protein TNCV_2461601 [Trichonephila clavipes]